MPKLTTLSFHTNSCFLLEICSFLFLVLVHFVYATFLIVARTSSSYMFVLLLQSAHICSASACPYGVPYISIPRPGYLLILNFNNLLVLDSSSVFSVDSDCICSYRLQLSYIAYSGHYCITAYTIFLHWFWLSFHPEVSLVAHPELSIIPDPGFQKCAICDSWLQPLILDWSYL